MSATCCCASSPRWYHRAAEVAGWVLPTATLALLPKCPACVVAYIALFTGVGISITLATYLRTTLLIVSFATLTFVAARLGCHLFHLITREHHDHA
jgi:hypothetical protein